MQAKDLKKLTADEIVRKIGKLCTEDQKKTGVLACVTLAQFILESGWGQSELAQQANNCFGMKVSLSGNTWAGSTWDGKSYYRKRTQEYDGGEHTITADFRKYPSIEASIGDHSAYLTGAMNGAKKRYAGLKGCTDYEDAIEIIAAGGYATSPSYKRQIIDLIQDYKLTKYNYNKEGGKMRINVHAGHTKQNGRSAGAGSAKTGIYESVEDRKIKDEVIKILRAKGHTVYDCTAEGNSMRDNLEKIVAKCNAHSVDLDISIHLNCFNGQAHGTETHLYSSASKAKKYAERTCKNLASLGFTNRGIKVSPSLYVLRHTAAPAMLIETFFCDSVEDCSIYRTKGYKKVAEMIAKAIDTKAETASKTYTGKLPAGTVGVGMGSTADVKLWQKALCWFGDDVEVDGIFGKDTKAKTIACQKRLGVEPDGYVGKITKAAFKAYKK